MNVSNRTLFISDNLPILRGINSESIDLIYLDPPFGSKRIIKAEKGSLAEGVSFKDFWIEEDIEHQWHGEIAEAHDTLYDIIRASEFVVSRDLKNYLTAMAVRLFEMKRVLKRTGSIYLHCDSTANAYLRIIMDALFGKHNFRREITWSNEDSSGFKSKANNWIRSAETIFYYVKSKEYTFNKEYMDRADKTIKRYDKIDENGRHYKIYRNKDGSERRSYLDASKGVGVRNVWADIPSFQRVNKRKKDQSGEYTGYPTQKPLALLERIIKSSSNNGDVVLDPFCGCATACIAAEKLNRQWIGIDQSEDAETITKIRLQDEVDKGADLWNPLEDIRVCRTLPHRTDQKQLPHPKTHKNTLYGIQEGNCKGCKIHFRIRNLTIDHIVPDAGDHIENLQLLCGACNSVKGNRTQEYLINRLKEQELL